MSLFDEVSTILSYAFSEITSRFKFYLFYRLNSWISKSCDILTRVCIVHQVGDDLRQDSLVLQVIKVMDSLWLKAELDLRIVTFQALPTSDKRGKNEIIILLIDST